MSAKFRIGLMCLVVVGLLTPLGHAATKDTMHLVYAALTRLLPLALDESSFDDESQLEEMQNALQLLERSAGALSEHGGNRSLEFEGLARSFENNVVLLKQMLEADRRSEFNYLTLDLTQNCVSCHALLPAESDFEMAALLSKEVLHQLGDSFDEIQLQIATRQFDAALVNLEGLILDPETHAVDLELDGILFDYASVGVQVTGELKRLAKVFGKFSQKAGVPYYLKRYAGIWVDRLNTHATAINDDASLDSARSAFNTATQISPVPNAQTRLIDDLFAASQIRRLLDGDVALDDAERAELYWMLGVISIRSVNPRPGVPQTEVLLEAAIRNGPGTQFARHAYALLEEFNRVSFAGIDVAELPDTLLNLDELKRLAGVE